MRQQSKPRSGDDGTASLADLRGERVTQQQVETAPTSLIRASLEAARTPLRDLRPGQLRVLFSQDGPLAPLLPAAMALLDADALIEATYFPGDLLCVLIESGEGLWTADAAAARRVRDLVSRQRAAIDAEGDPVASAVAAFMERPSEA